MKHLELFEDYVYPKKDSSSQESEIDKMLALVYAKKVDKERAQKFLDEHSKEEGAEKLKLAIEKMS